MLLECAKAFSGFRMARKVPARNQAIIRNTLACNMVRMWTKIFPGTFHPKQVKSRSGSLTVAELGPRSVGRAEQGMRPQPEGNGGRLGPRGPYRLERPAWGQAGSKEDGLFLCTVTDAPTLSHPRLQPQAGGESPRATGWGYASQRDTPY